LSLAAIYRGRKEPAEAERIVSALTQSSLPLSWYGCARGEQWLANPIGRSPRPLLDCPATAEKPYLDGQLNEAAWQQATELKSLEGPTALATTVLLAHDEQFLYFAARCQKEPSASYALSPGPRPRDSDLTGRDRIDLVLDVDRDYSTYFRFSVDHRGWTHDACGAEPGWDPAWHVAAAEDEDHWTVEAAIPLKELASWPLDQPWGVNIQRVLPSGGLQSWSTPASASIQPEGCGYLIFRPRGRGQ
jgi:hypothetical protein